RCGRDPSAARTAPAPQHQPRDHRDAVGGADRRAAARTPRTRTHERLPCGHAVDRHGHEAAERQPQDEGDRDGEPTHVGEPSVLDGVGGYATSRMYATSSVNPATRAPGVTIGLEFIEQLVPVTPVR